MKKSFILTLLMAFVLMAKASSHDPDRLVGTHWTFLPNYEHNLTITGIIILDGESLQNSPRAANLEIGAFCGDECRGSYLADYVSLPFFNGYAYQMQVYSNQASGEQIIFRVYDHEADMELDVTCLSNMQFIANTQHGNLRTPYEFVFYSNYTITTTANPSGGGQVTGGGNYMNGTNCTLTATANSAYDFVNWTKNGTQVSANATYSFTVNESAEYVANFTLKTYNISASANPTQGGTVSGSGTYTHGTSCTLTATPGSNYDFVNWTKNGSVVSTNPNYTFTVTGAGNYVANFTLKTYNITATVNPAQSGTVTGGGSYTYGTTCTLTALANQDYVFVNWTENGTQVSTNASYSFTVNGARSLVANFYLDLPELHVMSLSHSDFIAGQQASVTWKVRNDGVKATPDGEVWYDRVWLSLESRVAADDNDPILLGEFANVAALGPGEYYTQTQSFNIPLNLSGPYYLFVITDAYDCHHIYWENDEVPLPYAPPPYIASESAHCSGSHCGNYSGNRILEATERIHGGQSYHDNFFYDYLNIEVPPLPDLQVTSIITPIDQYSGTIVSVLATVSNTGEAFTNVSRWSDALYVSQSNTFDASTAIYLGNVQHNGILAPDESYDVTLTGMIPQTYHGDVYFYVYTDVYGQVYEHVANDNNVSRSQLVNIILLPPADLIPTEINTPATISTGQSLSVSYTVYNQGAGDPYVSSWRDKLYLSSSPDGLQNPIELKTIYHSGGLAPDATYSVSETISLPSSLSAGNYYVYVVIDADEQVFEYTSEDNNTLRSESALTVVKPDLAITQIVSENTLTACYPATFSYTLQNVGVGVIDNVSVTDKLYMSQNSNMNGATLLTTKTHALSLSAQQSISFNVSVEMPNLSEGVYYLFVVTDTGNVLNELNESNNRQSYHPVSVLHQPLPDLTATSFTLPSVIQAGSPIEVAFDVANIGDLNLSNSNCKMNVYALQGNQQILCPVQSQAQPPLGNITIPVNGTVHFSRTVMIPANVHSSCNTFMLKVDAQNEVLELNESNNTSQVSAIVLDCPLPDLTASAFTFPSTLQAGGEIQVSFNVNNTGEAPLETTGLNAAVYAVWNGSEVLCPLKSQTLPAQGQNIQLQVGASVHFEQTVLLPPMVNHNCVQFMLMIDPNNTIYETSDDNNIMTASVTVQDYPFNLKVESVAFPSEITAGQTYSVSWTVKNIGTCPTASLPMFVNKNGTYLQVQGNNLPYPWVDKVYFSTDGLISNDDVCVSTQNRTTVLNPNQSYTVTASFVVPYTLVGQRQLIVATDCTEVTYDVNRSNNTHSQPVMVLLGELPDLKITNLEVEPVMTADQSYTINYTVVNEGDGATTLNQWKDVFYIGSTENNTSGAYRLAERTHNGILGVGETYSDSFTVTIPSGISGDYYVIGFTDATSIVYEHDNEDDNITSVPVIVTLPLPCDLTIVNPSYTTAAVSGESITVSWTLFNIGNNPASGRIKDAVYLSEDNEWSSDDMMLGYNETNINLEANGQLDREFSTLMQGVPQGDYYLIIKSNILHALNEASYDNNTCVGPMQMNVGYPILTIGSSVDRTMDATQYLYYKIEVGSEYVGQTLSCQLTTTSSYPGNGLYVAYESAPSMSEFDFSANTPYDQNLEILIPSLQQGDYYLLARGSARDGQPQNITLSASIINFEILHVDADHGSNTGSLTTQVIGARFDSIMDFRLVQGDDYMPAEKVFFSNSTESFVTFNLKDLEAGLYDLEAELPGGIITIKDDAFTIEEGLPAELSVNIIAPSSVRSGNTFTVGIEYGNIGSTDLNVSGLMVVSQNGHYISLETEGLAERETELYFDTAEPNGNPDVLRPGSRNTRTIFVKANNANTVRLSIYAIRNIY